MLSYAANKGAAADGAEAEESKDEGSAAVGLRTAKQI